jgi:hypothetical protein
MLTDELTASLREHADSVSGDPAMMLAAVANRTKRHNRTRGVAAGAMLVLAAGAIVSAVQLANTHRHAGGVSVGGAVPVPCDTPTQVVPRLLDWPCLTGSFSRYYNQQTQAIKDEAIDLFAGVPAADLDLQVRVLGFGPVPNGRPGSTVVYAEVWQRGSRAAAKIGYNFAKPAKFSPGSDQAPADDAVAFPYLVAPMPAGDPALIVTRPMGTFAVRSRKECRAIASNQAPLTVSHPASCSDTVVAQGGITAIRIDQGDGHVGPLTPIVAGIAGLAEGVHPSWTIQGLDSSGAVIASVPYRPTPGLDG